MPDWVIWYEDGSSFSSDDGHPFEAPRWGVLVVAQKHEQVGRYLTHRADYYVWKGWWCGADFSGLLDYLLNTTGAEKVVLAGRTVGIDRMREVFDMAACDPRLPAKSSRHPSEYGRP